MSSLPINATVFIIFFLRVVLGLRFLFSGWIFVTKRPRSATTGRFAYIAQWALFVIGVCLTFGIFVRPASIIGIGLMAIFWFSKFPNPEGIVDEHLVYVGAFLMLILVNAGIFWGYDYLLLQIPAVLRLYQSTTWFGWLL